MRRRPPLHACRVLHHRRRYSRCSRFPLQPLQPLQAPLQPFAVAIPVPMLSHATMPQPQPITTCVALALQPTLPTATPIAITSTVNLPQAPAVPLAHLAAQPVVAPCGPSQPAIQPAAHAAASAPAGRRRPLSDVDGNSQPPQPPQKQARKAADEAGALSAYERERLENIERNKVHLRTLGLPTGSPCARAQRAAEAAPRPPRAAKPPPPTTRTLRSAEQGSAPAAPAPAPATATATTAAADEDEALRGVVLPLFASKDERSVKTVCAATGLTYDALRPRLAAMNILDIRMRGRVFEDCMFHRRMRDDPRG